MATPSAAEIAYQTAHSSDDRRPTVIVPNIVCPIAAYVAVLLRFESRRIARTKLRADDWWIVAGLIFTTGYAVSYSLTVKYGMGRHAIFITNVKSFTITAITAESFYTVSIFAIKLSILFLYRRIFPQRWFKHTLIVLGGFIVAYTLAQVFYVIFQCVPISSAWNPNETGKCVPYGSLALAMGIVNILTDITMLILPIPLLWKLNVSGTRKWMLTVMFSLGGFVCITSIVRQFYLRKVGSTDPSYDDVQGATISTIEICVGVISACLPTYRPLWNRYGGRRSNERPTRATSKAYGSKSTELKHLKSSENRSWGNTADDHESVKVEGPYSRLGNVSGVESQWKAHRREAENNEIIVTRGFASDTTDL
ncbi:hypothetical protein MMC28_005856 [Mycoblastus sanguinarius]|nr:hypothetical protein [Mycoblastus sanguinarius]